MRKWAGKAKGESNPLLAIPLGHDFPRCSDVSFADLRGHDRAVAGLVRSCAGLLDIHLCTLEKSVSKSEDRSGVESTSVTNMLRKWRTVDDKAEEHKTISDFPLDRVVMHACEKEPFYKSPDEVSHSGDYDHDAPDDHTSPAWIMHAYFRTAVLVLWPKSCRMKALSISRSPYSVIKRLEEMHGGAERDTVREELMNYLVPLSTTDAYDCSISSLLVFCLEHDYREAAGFIMRNWGLELIGDAATHAIVSTMRKYGWEECAFEELFEKREILTRRTLVQAVTLVEQLKKHGFQDAAVWLARKLLSTTQDAEVLEQEPLFGLFVQAGME